MPYPSAGLQLLLLEEVHTSHHHVGGEKMHHILASRWYWPNMRQSCTKYV